ncbi:resistin-like [Pyxicephalus adspersus]|uniref:Resistin n=1 Tax=Pyxicephalus adspersus TaxID=30357 RepID=A0AAV2ZYZ2_PYXAD|nr:TPA: hypothetical protein GDO54_014724 [Pyxicephalus adspersus]
MKIYMAILLLLPLLGLVNGHGCDEACTVENAIKYLVEHTYPVPELDCTTVNARGADVSCPTGYLATGCSCGMACGSWNLVGKSQCHCQCANIDWTSAVCCRNVRS